MRIILFILFFSVGVFSLDIVAQIRFPYENSLKSTSPADVVRVGADERFTPNGVLLTPTTISKRGAIFLDGVSFTSANGIVVEFDYDMYGGTMFDTSYGDGISVFLYDATAATSDLIGSYGAGLGYTYNRTNSSNTSYRTPGLNKGYLGIGLDQFGNYKGLRTDDNSRVSGFGNLNWKSKGRSHVTIRGAMHPKGLTGVSVNPTEQGPRYAGYPDMVTQSTIANADSSGTAYGRQFDWSNNTSTTVGAVNRTALATPFNLRGGVLNSTVNSTGYRRAIIELVPNINGGFDVTVKIKHSTVTTVVINKFYYKPSFYYYENANYNEDTALASTIHELEATPPAAFKIGFSASTGASSQGHLIKNLKVSIPYLPETFEDVVMMCTNMNREVIIDVFGNDYFYNGPLFSIPTKGNTSTYIDFDEFRFEDKDGRVLARVMGGQAKYSIPNVGSWLYNSYDHMVTFKPDINYRGPAEMYYSSKGLNTNRGPFGQEIYRSDATKITVNVNDCGGRVNPQISPQVSMGNVVRL